MQLDFTKLVMNGMLAFLLFAGALEVHRQAAGTCNTGRASGPDRHIISVVLVGAGSGLLHGCWNQPLAFEWALVFGALISPTDPVAVLSTLKHVKVPKNLQVENQGESLFNDGIGSFCLQSSSPTPSAGAGRWKRAALSILPSRRLVVVWRLEIRLGIHRL